MSVQRSKSHVCANSSAWNHNSLSTLTAKPLTAASAAIRAELDQERHSNAQSCESGKEKWNSRAAIRLCLLACSLLLCCLLFDFYVANYHLVSYFAVLLTWQDFYNFATYCLLCYLLFCFYTLYLDLISLCCLEVRNSGDREQSYCEAAAAVY